MRPEPAAPPGAWNRWTVGLLTVGASVHLALLLQAWRPKSLGGLVFALVVLAPWLLLAGCARASAGRRWAVRSVQAALLGCFALGTWAYVDTLYVHPDAQGGLIFVVVPVLGVGVAGVLLVVLLVTRLPPGAGLPGPP